MPTARTLADLVAATDDGVLITGTPTGDPGAWQLLPGSTSTADLVSQTERGLLVTRFWYLRWLDPNTLTITGLTRDGVFMGEGGQVVGPVNNFRFNHSPVALLANLDALGSEAVRVGGAKVPALRSRDFLMASVSDAI
jgi:predicted Zn-dependent protease